MDVRLPNSAPLALPLSKWQTCLQHLPTLKYSGMSVFRFLPEFSFFVSPNLHVFINFQPIFGCFGSIEIRPNKINCLFPVTCSQNLGMEGRKKIFFCQKNFSLDKQTIQFNPHSQHVVDIDFRLHISKRTVSKASTVFDCRRNDLYLTTQSMIHQHFKLIFVCNILSNSC